MRKTIYVAALLATGFGVGLKYTSKESDSPSPVSSYAPRHISVRLPVKPKQKVWKLGSFNGKEWETGSYEDILPRLIGGRGVQLYEVSKEGFVGYYAAGQPYSTSEFIEWVSDKRLLSKKECFEDKDYLESILNEGPIHLRDYTVTPISLNEIL